MISEEYGEEGINSILNTIMAGGEQAVKVLKEYQGNITNEDIVTVYKARVTRL